MNAFEKLNELSAKKKSHIILGLDPNDEMIDDIKAYGGLEQYLKYLIDETADFVVAVKPNIAFYEESEERRKILKTICEYAHSKGLLVVLDAKRGDIADTQTAYAKADIANYKPDIVTISGYLGAEDTAGAYLKQDPNICVYLLAATSNASAVSFQNSIANGLTIYQNVVEMARKYDSKRIGFVVGATKPDAMKQIRALEMALGYDLSNILAPGFGKQGGDLLFAKLAGKNAMYPISSGLTKKAYLDGLSVREAANNSCREINAQIDGSTPKSMLGLVIDSMIENAILKLAPSTDEITWFKLKSGAMSPIYADVRNIQAYPELLNMCCWLIAKQIRDSGIAFDQIAAVPYGALSLAYGVAHILGKPVLTPRKEGAKDHGSKDAIVGRFKQGNKVLIIEDVATSGSSTIETTELLRANGLLVNDAIVLIDREQGAAKNLSEKGIRLLSGFTLSSAFKKQAEYEKANGINKPMTKAVAEYLKKTRL